ncbi:MAG TPA: Stp1/IreP family PP2C-type Ser/Thr phosphatase [Gammaproteobacteria bacterium]|nr:Stp1/IreP family PP2C-type Ser/Thr phosphatase [Gammaproteobacteria bacterium]
MGSGLEIVNVSDVGRKRPHNEDSTASNSDIGIFVLADGMGGYKAGEVASAIAVMTILDDVGTGLKKVPSGSGNGGIGGGFSYHSDLVKKAIDHANSNIYQLAQSESDCEGMGTTVVIGLVCGDRISIGNVGDSRLYRLRNNQFEQITKDHSLIQELIDRGFYTPEEAAEKTPRNLVTRALGLDAGVEVDIIEDQVLPGDIYLLCSDGLNDMVNDEEIHLTLSKYSANLVRAADELVRMANSNGGKDNISVVLVRVKEITATPGRGGNLQKLFSRFF